MRELTENVSNPVSNSEYEAALEVIKNHLQRGDKKLVAERLHSKKKGNVRALQQKISLFLSGKRMDFQMMEEFNRIVSARKSMIQSITNQSL